MAAKRRPTDQRQLSLFDAPKESAQKFTVQIDITQVIGEQIVSENPDAAPPPELVHPGIAPSAPRPSLPRVRVAPPPPEVDVQTALQLHRNVALFAGAGAGKTYSLVTMALHVLGGARQGFEPVPASKLSLVTFTDKAAAEMRSRLRARLDGLVHGVEEPLLRQSYEQLGRSLPEVEFWRGLRDELGAAFVGTFHSLCVQILRRAPAGSGVDPSFELLEERETRLLARHVTESAVLEALEAGDSVLGDVTRDLGFGTNSDFDFGLVTVLSKLFLRLREEGVPASAAAVTDAARARARFEEQLEALRQASRTARASLRTGKQVHKLLEFDGLVRAMTFESVESCWGTLKDLSQHFGSNDTLKPIRPFVDEKQADNLLELYGACLVAPYEERLRGLLARIAEDFEAELTRRRAVDFSGLLIRTRDLLRDSLAARREAQERIGVLLVDEFQDTNRLQLEIVLLLAESRATGPRPVTSNLDFDSRTEETLTLALEPGLLAVVGDRKQAIYEFRGADVSVFEVMARSIVKSGGARAYLSSSRRSSPRLVKAVNELMTRVLAAPADGALPFEVVWQPHDALTAVREEQLERVPVIRLDDPTLFEETKPSSEQVREADAAAIARWVSSTLNSEEGAVIDRHGQPRRARGQDIALLFQRYSNLEAYRQQLVLHGVRHRVVRGRGFYGAQEVMDVASFLTVVTRPDDVIALAAVLRSPFVGLSDASLLRLAMVNGAIVGLDARRALRSEPPDELTGLERERFERFRKAYPTFQLHAERLGVRGLLDVAFAELDVRVAIAGAPYGEQALANLEKLLELASERAEAGLSPPGFARELVELFSSEPKEAQAEVIDSLDPDVVTLSTVHQAKGLEWPIVVLPELFAKPNNERGALAFDRDVGLGLRPPMTGELQLKAVQHARIGERRKRRADAERRRLLYVAATRARDLLVLGVRSGAKPPEGTWEAFLDFQPIDAVDAELLVPSELPDVPPPSPLAEPFDADARALAAVERVRTSLPVTTRAALLPVTQLQEFATCPRRAHFAFQVGLAEERIEREQSAADVTTESGDVRARGTAVHRLLEVLPLERFGDGVTDELLRALQRSEGLEDDADVRKWVRRFVETPFAKSIATHDVRRELPFVLALTRPGAVTLHLRGQIDLVVAEGSVVRVIDYKTSFEPKAGLSQYAFQLDCYELAARRFFKGATAIEVGLVFLREDKPEPRWLRRELDVAELEDRLITTAHTMVASQLEGTWQGRPHAFCRELECGFMKHCWPPESPPL